MDLMKPEEVTETKDFTFCTSSLNVKRSPDLNIDWTHSKGEIFLNQKRHLVANLVVRKCWYANANHGPQNVEKFLCYCAAAQLKTYIFDKDGSESETRQGHHENSRSHD